MVLDDALSWAPLISGRNQKKNVQATRMVRLSNNRTKSSVRLAPIWRFVALIAGGRFDNRMEAAGHRLFSRQGQQLQTEATERWFIVYIQV